MLFLLGLQSPAPSFVTLTETELLTELYFTLVGLRGHSVLSSTLTWHSPHSKQYPNTFPWLHMVRLLSVSLISCLTILSFIPNIPAKQTTSFSHCAKPTYASAWTIPYPLPHISFIGPFALCWSLLKKKHGQKEFSGPWCIKQCPFCPLLHNILPTEIEHLPS